MVSGKDVSEQKPVMPVVLMYPAAGAALTGEQIEERTRELPDELPAKEIVESKLYRDGLGRMRIEWSIQGAPFPMVYLLDPVAGSVTILLVEAKAAKVHLLPSPGYTNFRVGFPSVGIPLPDGKWHLRTESLGTRAIEGLYAAGTRTTSTSEDQPPLVSIVERWTCNGLAFEPLVSASGPNWKHTVRIRNLRRVEPDAALFVIPSDFAIH